MYFVIIVIIMSFHAVPKCVFFLLLTCNKISFSYDIHELKNINSVHTKRKTLLYKFEFLAIISDNFKINVLK